MIDDAFELVAQFQLSANQPVAKYPTKLASERVQCRKKWMQEEINEFVEATDIYEQVDALTDLLYYLLGAYVEIGVKPDSVFQIVHNSNMAKLFCSEGVIKDTDGKVEKPKEWKHPDDEIRKAIDSLMP